MVAPQSRLQAFLLKNPYKSTNVMKNKEITITQINGILQAVYQTNISAQVFDSIKKLLAELPDITETKNEDKKDTTAVTK